MPGSDSAEHEHEYERLSEYGGSNDSASNRNTGGAGGSGVGGSGGSGGQFPAPDYHGRDMKEHISHQVVRAC